MMLPYALKENEVMAIRFDGTNAFDIIDVLKATPYRLDYFRFDRVMEDPQEDGSIRTTGGSMFMRYVDEEAGMETSIDMEIGDWFVDTGHGLMAMPEDVFANAFMRVP